MPIIRAKDSIGCYFRWGGRGKRYYYTPNDKESRNNAKNKAIKQMRAAYFSGYKGK